MTPAPENPKQGTGCGCFLVLLLLVLAIAGMPQDTWGPDTDITIATVKGIPVASGQEDIELRF